MTRNYQERLIHTDTIYYTTDRSSVDHQVNSISLSSAHCPPLPFQYPLFVLEISAVEMCPLVPIALLFMSISFVCFSFMQIFHIMGFFFLALYS